LASSGLPAGCTARPIELDDIPALVAMFRRRDEALGVAPEPAGDPAIQGVVVGSAAL
jgi:hypothetical protein